MIKFMVSIGFTQEMSQLDKETVGIQETQHPSEVEMLEVEAFGCSLHYSSDLG